jgi:DUF2975 family protein
MDSRSLALLLRGLTWVGAVLVLLMPSLMWLAPHAGTLGARNILLVPPLDAGDGSRPLLLAIVLPPYLVVAWGLVQLSGFCDRLARGDHLSRAAAIALKRFGWSLIASAALLPISRFALCAYLLSPVSGWELVHGLVRPLPVLAMALGLILGLIMIVFAAILEQATALAEESARFV